MTSEASIEFKDEDKLIAEGMEEGLSADEVYVERVLPGKMRWNLMALKKESLVEMFKTLLDTVKIVLR